MRVLYVEDNQYLAEAVVHLLGKERMTVDWVDDGEKGLELALQPIYDVAVLDVMLPKLSGLEVLQTMRRRGVNTPVIILSALSEVEDKVRGLQVGADDYLAKPFKTSELIARIYALTRRPPLQDTEEISFGDLTLSVPNRTLNGLPLTAKETELMRLLMRSPDRAQPKAQILAHIWGRGVASDENYVEVYISYLRKKLRQLRSAVQIKTVRGLGYQLTTGED